MIKHIVIVWLLLQIQLHTLSHKEHIRMYELVQQRGLYPSAQLPDRNSGSTHEYSPLHQWWLRFLARTKQLTKCDLRHSVDHLSTIPHTRQKHIQTRCLLFITDYKNKILSTEMTRLHTFSGPFPQLPGSTRSRQITMPAPHHSVLYRPDALPATKPTASKHWRH